MFCNSIEVAFKAAASVTRVYFWQFITAATTLAKQPFELAGPRLGTLFLGLFAGLLVLAHNFLVVLGGD